jgi:hypothetical protein
MRLLKAILNEETKAIFGILLALEISLNAFWILQDVVYYCS